MNAAIKILEEANEKYERTKRTYLSDKELGFTGKRKYFDPVFYDAKSHEEVKRAIQLLKSPKTPPQIK